MGNNDDILVSICCITYNHEDYIEDCIKGFLIQQTNFQFEILIHDDASTDHTLDIIHDYQKRYPNLFRVYEEKENQYCKHERSITKILIDDARGKYIAFCEGDDYWIDPYKLQRQIDLFQQNPEMTYCFTNRFVRNEMIGVTREQTHKNRKYTYIDFLSGFNPGIQTACFLRKSFTNEDADFIFSNRINGDRGYPIMSCQKGYALCVPEITAVYRVTGKGVSTSISKNKSRTAWFKHTINDLYHLHEVFEFPSSDIYIKSITPYTFNYLRNTGNFATALTVTSQYNREARLWLVVKIIFSLLFYGFKRLNLHVKNIIQLLFKKCIKTLISNQFSSIVFECGNQDVFCVAKMKATRFFHTKFLNLNNGPVTIADAFLFSSDKEMCLYYEYQKYIKAKGVIMMSSTSDGEKWSVPKIVLEEDFHLSFPNVFESNGGIYMLPETFQTQQVRLYHKMDQGEGFEYHSTLLEGEKFVDSFIYEKDNTFYLFTSIQKPDNSYILKLYYSDYLDKGYQEHPVSPLSEGKYMSRNAGKMIEYNGKLFRPAQECSSFYGQNVHIFEVIKLSRTEYEEHPYRLDIIPKGSGFGIGGHQFSCCKYNGKDYVGIDILHKAVNVHNIIKRLIRKFK